jgi:hypothetical protein
LHTLRPMSCTNSMDMPPLYTFLGPGTCRVMVSLNAVIVMSKQWSQRDGPWSTPAFNHCLLYETMTIDGVGSDIVDVLRCIASYMQRY